MSISQNFPTISPSLSLNFARSKTLDPRITFSRTSTATRVNETGLIEVMSADEPRFDHRYENGVVKSLGLLVEEQRENLVDYSESFDSWDSGNVDIGINTTTAPDGTQNADSLIERDQNYTGGAYKRKNVSIGSAYSGQLTFSVFLKSAEVTTVGLIIDIPELSDPRANVDLTSSTTSGSGINSTYIVESFPNDWKRVSLTTTNSLSSYTGSFVVALYLNGYTGFDNTGNYGDKVFVWGAQLERGAFSTSYIPTSGSTKTRSPDNVSMTGENFSDWYNPTEGTFFTEVTTGTTASTGSDWFRITDGNANVNSIRLTRSGVGATPQLLVTKNGISQTGPFTTNIQANIFYRLGCYYKNNDFGVTNNASSLSGSSISTSGEVPDAVNRILISNPTVNGHIKTLTYYPRRLTNSQLQNLTK